MMSEDQTYYSFDDGNHVIKKEIKKVEMNHDSSSRPSDGDIERMLIEAVAQLRVTDVSEIEQQFAENGNDLEMDSQEAVTVIANVEVALKCTLPGMEQLKPRQPTSIRALLELIVRHLDSLVTVDSRSLARFSSVFRI